MDKTTQKEKISENDLTIYGSDARGQAAAKFAVDTIQLVNDALVEREQPSKIWNGVTYSTAYEHNKARAINYAPPKNKDEAEKQMSLGIVHEKIVSFVAIFLKYVFKEQITSYDNDGNEIEDLGDVYELAIEHSKQLERFDKKLALIYWEVFTQGDAFVLEDWVVKTIPRKIAVKDGKALTPDNMDYTYEFLEGLKYTDGKKVQTRMAESRLLDGRSVILADPTLDDANGGLQAQQFVVIEELIPRKEAEKIYGTLKMWKHVPKSVDNINTVTDNVAKQLFDGKRIKNPENYVLVHRYYSKADNRFNIFVNGIMMLPYETPLTIFYPRGNYPISQFSAERVSGSAYSRSIPAKVKFNADYVDWILRKLAERFEKDLDPALLVRGKYTLTKDLFKAGQRTHGITRDMYEKADPDDKGMTNAHFSFYQIIKDIVESQTINPTTSGELSNAATATEIATVDQNQRDKLAFLLDGLIGGYIDFTLRRAETIETKYTLKRKYTVVDGERIPVYQNFTVNIGGTKYKVDFDERLETDRLYDYETKVEDMFEAEYNEEKMGNRVRYYVVNPHVMRGANHSISVEIQPEKLKDSSLQFIQMRDEFSWLLQTFPNVNRNEMQEEYLRITNRDKDIFLPAEIAQLQQQAVPQQQGQQLGLKDAVQQQLGYGK